MKNKLHYFILLFVLAALTGCNEKLSIETEIQGAPEISEFTPTSGKAGTEITVKGSNLRDIVSATIGGVESQILYKLSQQEIVIVVPLPARTMPAKAPAQKVRNHSPSPILLHV